jgi:energy-coupling factor transporter ATP-binding protein EcfA2
VEEVIRVEDLSFQYPDYPEVQFAPLFEHLDFSLKRGEIGVILGKPDSGKSTLSRILAGYIPRHTGGRFQGSVTVMGEDVSKTEPYELIDRIGIVFQNPEEQIISTRCDVEIAFGLESLGLSRETIEERVDEALSFLNIYHLKERNPATLSDGEKKKLLFACLCAVDPEIFLLDEAFEELDPPSRRLMLEYLESESKTVLILTAKLLDIYSEYANRLFLLSDEGIIENEGQKPKGLFLARSKADGVIPGPWFSRGVSVGPRSVHPFTDDQRSRGIRTRVTKAAGTPSQTSPLLEATGLRFHYRTEYVATTGPVTPRGAHSAGTPAVGAPTAAFSLKIDRFELRRGEVLSLIGRNGSGKSTLGKLLSGLLVPEQGSIKILFEDSLQKATPQQLNYFTAYMFQNPDYQIFLPTVEEELSYGLRAIGLSQRESKYQVQQAIELFNLPEASVPPALMSYGARKRLQAAIYYLLDRPFVILDEADSGISLKDFLDMLSLFTQRGCTPAVITHDIRIATLVSDRIVLLQDGQVSSAVERAGFEELTTRFILGLEASNDHRFL